jgi:hypothetical protein
MLCSYSNLDSKGAAIFESGLSPVKTSSGDRLVALWEREFLQCTVSGGDRPYQGGQPAAPTHPVPKLRHRSGRMGRAVAKPINIITSSDGFHCVLPILPPKNSDASPCKRENDYPCVTSVNKEISL